MTFKTKQLQQRIKEEYENVPEEKKKSMLSAMAAAGVLENYQSIVGADTPRSEPSPE